MDYNWPILAVLALAAARVTRLVTDDLLPFGPLRTKLSMSLNPVLQYIGYGMKCTFCSSVYSGAAAAGLAVWQGWIPQDFWLFMVFWWAFSGAVVILELIVFALNGDDE